MLWLVTDGPGDADGKAMQVEQLFERIGTVPPKPAAESEDDAGDENSEGPIGEAAKP